MFFEVAVFEGRHSSISSEEAAHVRRALEMKSVGDAFDRHVGAFQQCYHRQQQAVVDSVLCTFAYAGSRNPVEVLWRDAQSGCRAKTTCR